MAKKATAPARPIKEQPEYAKHVCGECGHGNWVETSHNKDWQGKYICLTCQYQQHHILRCRQACPKFEPKQKGKEGNNE